MTKRMIEKEDIKQKIEQTINMLKEKWEKAYAQVRISFSSLSKKQILTIGGTVAGVIVIGVAVLTLGDADAPKAKAAGESAAVAQSQQQELTGWVFKVDGKTILRVASEEDAWNVFYGVRDHFVTEGAEVVDVAFRQGIDLKDVASEPKNEDGSLKEGQFEIMTVADAIDYVLSGTKEKQTYTVASGDTLWDIANAYGINTYELQEMNPGFEPDKLHIGQELNLYSQKPFVTVVTTEVVTETQQIPYTTVYENSSSMYKGQSSVKTAGVFGSKEVKSQLVKENGYIIGETTLAETVISEPVAQVSLTGTQAAPVYTGSNSGTFAAPLSSYLVTSKYGASRGSSRRHMGIDMNCAKGTPFWAADDGVVVFAGWSGTYGNLIRVDHGGGVETRYAHCDSIGVSVGDKVSKGQVMGTVGRTGNATGYVLHFEVLINGSNKNPLDYI